jgi:Zn-dependent peptidase ImmA (M78 family)
MSESKYIIIQKKANQFRERNGISSNEPIRIKSLLIKLNILTCYKPLSDNFSGMSLKSDNNNLFILVNSNHSLGRQHFTIAHELYHLFEQEKFQVHQCTTGKFDKKNIEEYNADYFASCLLTPENGLLDLIPDNEITTKNISLRTVIKLEQYYSVSRSSMLLRLKLLEIIDLKQYELLKSYKVGETAMQYGYDTSLYKNGNQNLIIGDYGEKAKLLFDNEKISEGHYLELMSAIGIDLSDYKDEGEN